MEEAGRTNLSGTKHVVDFARAVRKAGNPVHLHHISTAYVSGTRTGTMREDELESGQEFFNYYEWSKFEAERVVRAAGRELPVTIYRPGIIVGDSHTGRTDRFHGIYQILRGIHLGLIDWLPCRQDFQLDITPVDYVSDAIVRLSQLNDSANKTFHLTAGPGNTLSLGELVDIYAGEGTACEGSKYRPGSLRFLPGPEESRTQMNKGSNVWKRFSHYVPYVTCPKTFDNRVMRAALPDLRAPVCREYLPKVVRYALNSGFAAPPAALFPVDTPAKFAFDLRG
jgi:thioester reductase-like protein